MAVEMDVERVRDMEPRKRAEYDAQVEERVIRFRELRPEWMAYREAALPAHERALYGYVGSVAAENPAFRSSVLDGENFCFTSCAPTPARARPSTPTRPKRCSCP